MAAAAAAAVCAAWSDDRARIGAARVARAEVDAYRPLIVDGAIARIIFGGADGG